MSSNFQCWQKPEWKPSPRQTACHEAGHAVVNLAMGRKVTLIDIRQGVDTPVCRSDWREGQSVDVRKLIISSYAGYIAEGLLTGGIYTTGTTGDNSCARKWAYQMVFGEENMQDYLLYWKFYWDSRKIFMPEPLKVVLTSCFDECSVLVEDNRTTIQRFADYLKCYSYMKEREVEHFWNSR
jgi:ATP-dependent Zn protease